MTRLDLIYPGATLAAADTETRRLRGIAIPYGQTGHTSAGTVVIDAGAVRVPANLRGIKLFREHGRTTPTGYTVEAEDTADALTLGFAVARTPDGDQALLEASEGLRDALSVELNNVVISAGHVTSADLVAVAQVAVPAFSGAQLAAADTDPAPADDTEELDPVPAEVTTEETEETTEEEEADMDPENTETAPGLSAAMMPPAGTGRTPDANTSMEVFAAQAVAAITGGSGTVAELNAALNDIVPANTADPGGSFMRPAWLGELWQAGSSERPLSTMLGLKDLTSATFDGWAWTLKPKVSHYPGNKTAVPSSPATSGLIESGPPTRIAGAWDIDRIYVDFNTGMLTSFLAGAADSYSELVEEDLGALLEATATDIGASADAISAITAVVNALVAVGASPSYIALASDVFAPFIALNGDDVPWWLAKQGTVNLTGAGSADIAQLSVAVVPSLSAGTVIAGDRRALDVRATGPIRVEAVNVPNGGIDVGLFGYENHIVNDARAIVSTTVTTVPAAVSVQKSK